MHSFTVLLLGSTVGFFSFYPASLPQLFHRRSPLNFSLGADAWLLLSFVHFSFSIPLLGFLFLPFHSYWLHFTVVCPAYDSTFILSFSLFTLTWSLMSSFQVPVLGFLFVSFRSILIHSHSCFSGDSLVLSLSGLSASSSLSFVRVLFASSYLAFCFFRSLLPDSIEQWFPQCFDSSFRLPRFPPYLPSGFPYFFSGFRYLAFCCFISSFPVSLPQLFHRWFPYSTSLRPFLWRDFLRPFDFLSSISVRFKLLSSLTFLFPSSRFPLSAVLSMLVFLIRPACCHAFLQIVVLSFLRFLSPIIVSYHRYYFNVSAFSLRKSADFPWLTL